MSQRQFDQLANLGHLLSAATNVIVADFVEVALLIFTLNGLAFAVDDGVLGDDTELGGVDFNHFELDLSHTATCGECVALTHRSICFAEVWGEEDVEDASGETFDSIGDRETRNTFSLKWSA